MYTLCGWQWRRIRRPVDWPFMFRRKYLQAADNVLKLRRPLQFLTRKKKNRYAPECAGGMRRELRRMDFLATQRPRRCDLLESWGGLFVWLSQKRKHLRGITRLCNSTSRGRLAVGAPSCRTHRADTWNFSRTKIRDSFEVLHLWK